MYLQFGQTCTSVCRLSSGLHRTGQPSAQVTVQTLGKETMIRGGQCWTVMRRVDKGQAFGLGCLKPHYFVHVLGIWLRDRRLRKALGKADLIESARFIGPGGPLLTTHYTTCH
jgi:hypothetical protein